MALTSDLLVSSVKLDVKVPDSGPELASSNMLSPVQVLATMHVGSDEEFLPILQWLSVSWLFGDGRDSPALIGSIVAVPPDDMSVVSVGSSVDIQALTTQVLDVPSVTSEESDHLVLIIGPLSQCC